MLNPYYSTSALSFTAAQQTLKLTYRDTLLYTERQAAKTTGLDAGGVRAAQAGFPGTATADPQMPIPSKSDNRLTLDLEGLVLNADGRCAYNLLVCVFGRLAKRGAAFGSATSTGRMCIGSTRRAR